MTTKMAALRRNIPVDPAELFSGHEENDDFSLENETRSIFTGSSRSYPGDFRSIAESESDVEDDEVSACEGSDLQAGKSNA